MKKRVLALVLAGTMIFGLTACNKGGNNDAGNGTDTETTSVEGETTTGETTEAQPVAQTTPITDYSGYVKIGAYRDLEIEVDAAVVTDTQIQSRKDQIVT